METKLSIRKKYLLKRKKYYFEVDKFFFKPLTQLACFKKVKYISIYYPSSYELNVLKILNNKYFKKFKFLLPVIEGKNSMYFCEWKKNDTLQLNQYGILEPIRSKKIQPDIILLPLLAFDKNKNRLGYGKGFYDKYLNRSLKSYKKITSIGVAFSFQKYNKLPTNSKDYRLNYIITEKGIF